MHQRQRRLWQKIVIGDVFKEHHHEVRKPFTEIFDQVITEVDALHEHRGRIDCFVERVTLAEEKRKITNLANMKVQNEAFRHVDAQQTFPFGGESFIDFDHAQLGVTLGKAQQSWIFSKHLASGFPIRNLPKFLDIELLHFAFDCDGQILDGYLVRRIFFEAYIH